MQSSLYKICKFTTSLVIFLKRISMNLERPNFLNIISIFMSYIDNSLFQTYFSPIPPRKLKVSWCNNLRASFEYTAINNHPSQPTGTYSILLPAVILAQIINNFKKRTCSYHSIFHIPICLLYFYIEQKPVIIFMNSCECTKTYSRYFFFINQMKKIENIPGHQKQYSEMF